MRKIRKSASAFLKQANLWAPLGAISATYGSKRGFLYHVAGQIWISLGGYQQEREVKWNELKRLIFLCRGNICRSPFAEGVARRHGLETLSFGLHTGDGLRADSRALEIAVEYGVDLTSHRTRQIASYVPDAHDLIIAMEPSHLQLLNSLCPQSVGIPTTLLGLWGQRRCPRIQDPYGNNIKYFRHCFLNIDNAVTNIKNKFHVKRN